MPNVFRKHYIFAQLFFQTSCHELSHLAPHTKHLFIIIKLYSWDDYTHIKDPHSNTSRSSQFEWSIICVFLFKNKRGSQKTISCLNQSVSPFWPPHTEIRRTTFHRTYICCVTFSDGVVNVVVVVVIVIVRPVVVVD